MNSEHKLCIEILSQIACTVREIQTKTPMQLETK